MSTWHGHRHRHTDAYRHGLGILALSTLSSASIHVVHHTCVVSSLSQRSQAHPYMSSTIHVGYPRSLNPLKRIRYRYRYRYRYRSWYPRSLNPLKRIRRALLEPGLAMGLGPFRVSVKVNLTIRVGIIMGHKLVIRVSKLQGGRRNLVIRVSVMIRGNLVVRVT